MDCERKSKTCTNQDVVSNFACMVVKCVDAQLLQFWHYHNYTYIYHATPPSSGGEAWKWGYILNTLS